MILTHFLGLLASPTQLVSPVVAVLPMANSEPLIGGSRLDLGLVPALKVQAAVAVLPVRQR